MIHPREKITFIRVTQTQDGSGQLVNTEAVFFSPKAAKVVEKRSSVDVIAQQGNITQVLEVELRYNPEVEILNGDFIIWRTYRFTNLSFRVDPLRRFIYITAFSEMESTSRESASS